MANPYKDIASEDILRIQQEEEQRLKDTECEHIFERLRLDFRRCIECGLEQLRYIDPVEPLKWVNKKDATGG